MRTTRDILADILVRPELDELRLEYADACEAKDPNYARYIRTELEYWRPGSSIHTPEGSEQVAKRISHPIMEYCYSVQMYRGFVEEVTMDPYVFINRGTCCSTWHRFGELRLRQNPCHSASNRHFSERVLRHAFPSS